MTNATFPSSRLHLEEVVETHLIDRLVALQGWRERRPDDYDRKLALDPDMVVEFLRKSQPAEWARLEAQYPGSARDELLRNLASRLAATGTLEVLRKGITIIPGIPFRICAFQPASGLNAELMRAYEANILSVTRQVRYSLKNENAIDVVLFVKLTDLGATDASLSAGDTSKLTPITEFGAGDFPRRKNAPSRNYRGVQRTPRNAVFGGGFCPLRLRGG